jgi:hypothetical protein
MYKTELQSISALHWSKFKLKFKVLAEGKSKDKTFIDRAMLINDLEDKPKQRFEKRLRHAPQ